MYCWWYTGFIPLNDICTCSASDSQLRLPAILLYIHSQETMPLLILNRPSPKPKKNDKFNSSGVIVVNIKHMEQLGAYFDTPHFGSFECCLYKYTLIFKLKTF